MGLTFSVSHNRGFVTPSNVDFSPREAIPNIDLTGVTLTGSHTLSIKEGY